MEILGKNLDEIISIKGLGGILIIAIVIIAFILVILFVKGKKDKEKRSKTDLNAFYLSKVKEIDTSNPKNVLSSIDKITRDFFREAFRIRKFIGYSELKKIFSKKNNEKVVEFCELMSKALYSKEKNSGKIQRLTELLTEIINANKISPSQGK